MPRFGAANPHKPSIRVRGRDREYLERRRIGRGNYFLLEHIGSPLRNRFLAFDPGSSPGGDFFVVQYWNNVELANQQFLLLRRMKDDSFPRVHHIQQQGESLEVVLSWTEGITLHDYFEHVRAGRRPSVASVQAVRLIVGLAHAVCKLHRKLQITHGDIQPSNIVLTSHPSQLKLIDFGSAWTKQTTSRRLDGDGRNGLYAAPENYHEQVVTGFLSDQFSVSVVLYELLTNQVPYGGLGGKAGWPQFVDKMKDKLVAPSCINPKLNELPAQARAMLDSLTMCGLALDSRNRFPESNSWLKELADLSAGLRLLPQLTPAEKLLTRVVRWFIDQRRKS